MHPSQLSNLLREELGSERFEPALVHAYASLLLHVATQKGKRHKRAGFGSVPGSSISLTYQHLQKHFGADGFKHINEHFDCIGHTPNWNHRNGETRAFWLTNKGREMIEETRLNAFAGRPNILVEADGTKIRKRSSGIYTARDKDGRNAVTEASIRFAIPVNMAAMEYVLDVGVALVFPECSPERLERIDGTLRTIHACALNDNIGHGYLPQTYRESGSGRLYGCYDLSLQNAVKEAKTIALHDAHEYDFANCHFQLLASAAMELDIDAPVISEYVENRGQFRESLANRIGISPKQAKTCLLAVMYGATQSLWQGCAIPREIGPEKARLLYIDSDFDALCLEIVEIGDLLRHHAERTSKGAIVNCRGKACIGNPKQELSHLLSGKESELLHVVLEQYGDHVLLLQHDGFALSKYVDRREIAAEISYRTGIDMPITHEKLGLMKKG